VALAINPRLKIVATPWSAPGWMKTSGSLIDGHLQPAAYGPFAKYFVKFIQAYQAAGVPIYAVTMQNEPLYIPKDYPGNGDVLFRTNDVLAR
jgi:glucosylceramidase